MDAPPDRDDPRLELQDDERAFDEYVERALSGDAPEPSTFVRERGGTAALRQALESVYRRSRRGTAAADGSLPFERLGEFRLIRRLGAGGMGLVFVAEQESLGRLVALKIIRPELQASAVVAERFDREARAVAQLRHPNIVAVHGAGSAHGVRFLAMELVEGSSLDELIKRGELARIPLARRVRWIGELARALDYAHAHGVVHRDVKPSNVRITEDGRARLLDFGLARIADAAGATLTDGFAGSPSYASPEQIAKSSAVDHRTDVYSLGVTLYQCLTGVVPFRGDTVEQVFHRILNAEPTPPRRIDPTIPRDLETVVLQAIERDVARRHSTAAAFADDLEAVLDLRPIRGRRPGVIERARRTAKRRPALAGAIAVAVLASVAVAITSIAQHRLRAAEVAADAARTIDLARGKVAEYRANRTGLATLKATVDHLREMQGFNYLDAAQTAVLDEHERKVADAERGWEQTFHEVLDLLRHAERLDPSSAVADGVRAELYFERYEEARDARDTDAAEFYRNLVVEHDAGGAFARRLAGEVLLSIETDPPGAEAFLFEYVEHATVVERGEPRFVPSPVGATEPPIAPGTWVLRVIAGAGEIERGDLIYELAGEPIEACVLVLAGPEPLSAGDRLVSVDGEPIDDDWAIEHRGGRGPAGDDGALPIKRFALRRGARTFELSGTSLADLGVDVATAADFALDPARPSVPARVFRGGALLELAAPPGIDVRPSATPILASPACSLGRTPIVDRALRSGSYLVVARLDGREERRFCFDAGHGEVVLRLELAPTGFAPPGFVPVDVGNESFWIQERETTCAEYLEFLRDPATIAAIAASTKPILVPRQSVELEGGALWTANADGAYELPDEWRPDWPIVGISWHDARAFAAWKTERARARGLPWTFALPTHPQYCFAGHGRVRWIYTWGTRYRAKWARSCFARPSAHIGPVMHYPVDESPFGVFDLCGSAFEWLDSWYDEERELRFLGGGAWGQPNPGTMRLWGGYGASADATSGETGVRLVLTIDPRVER